MARTQMEAVKMLGKGQNIFVRELIAKAYNEGLKAKSEMTLLKDKNREYKRGYADGLKEGLLSGKEYSDGVEYGIKYTGALLLRIMCVELHDHYGIEKNTLFSMYEDIFHHFDTTVDVEDIEKRCQEIGLSLPDSVLDDMRMLTDE